MSRYYDVTFISAEYEMITVRAYGNTHRSAERAARSKARRNGTDLSPFAAIQIQHVKETE